ncbi:MAG: hypothetical protein HYY78_05105 [Betaproteobacteria bacterium]|nr:hypothetical protein [Betaproteobacteria bacterium]
MSETSGIIDPSAGPGTQAIAAAPRAASLSGKVLGLLDNTKEQGDILLETIGAALRERYGVARVVSRRKEHYSKVAPDSLINEMAGEVDIAVAALGG